MRGGSLGPPARPQHVRRPAGLWGATRLLEPYEEPEHRAELARLAGSPLDDLAEEVLAATLRSHALELMRSIPPSRSAEPSLFTLEGDPVAFASAVWEVHDAAVAETIRALGAQLPDDPVEIDITAPRATLVKRRPPLPLGAVVLESSPAGAMDTFPIATIRLEGNELHGEAMSERLAQTIEIVAADFSGLVELRSQEVTSFEETWATRAAGRPDSRPSFPRRVDRGERRLIGELTTERRRRCLDEPPRVLGRTHAA